VPSPDLTDKEIAKGRRRRTYLAAEQKLRIRRAALTRGGDHAVLDGETDERRWTGRQTAAAGRRGNGEAVKEMEGGAASTGRRRSGVT